MSEKTLVVVDSWDDKVLGNVSVLEGGVVAFGDAGVTVGGMTYEGALGQRIVTLRTRIAALERCVKAADRMRDHSWVRNLGAFSAVLDYDAARAEVGP